MFYFSNLNENHELFRNKIEKVNGKFLIETPKKTGLMNLFVSEVISMHLNVERIVKIN